MPNRIKASTTKSLMPTIMLLSRADSLVPPISMAVSRRTMNAAGRLTTPATVEPSSSVTCAGSPAATRPPASITPSTPHLNLGPLLSVGTTCRLRPARNRSMSTQGGRSGASKPSRIEQGADTSSTSGQDVTAPAHGSVVSVAGQLAEGEEDDED